MPHRCRMAQVEASILCMPFRSFAATFEFYLGRKEAAVPRLVRYRGEKLDANGWPWLTRLTDLRAPAPGHTQGQQQSRHSRSRWNLRPLLPIGRRLGHIRRAQTNDAAVQTPNRRCQLDGLDAGLDRRILLVGSLAAGRTVHSRHLMRRRLHLSSAWHTALAPRHSSAPRRTKLLHSRSP